MEKEANLERFRVWIRPYKTIMGVGYAVVIPFDNKEDCLNFVRQTNLTLIAIDDDVPAETPLGPIGIDTIEKLLPEFTEMSKELAKEMTDKIKEDEKNR